MAAPDPVATSTINRSLARCPSTAMGCCARGVATDLEVGVAFEEAVAAALELRSDRRILAAWLGR
jgi:hypothetical protein